MPSPPYRVQGFLSGNSVGYLLRRLHALLLARLERAMQHEDFTMTQWIVLTHLREGRLRTASDIAHELSYDPGALTRVVDQLERRGLIVRRRSVRDRRVVELELTAAGRRKAEDLLPIVVDQMNAALAPLDRDEFEQFRSCLVRLIDHVSREAGAAPADSMPDRRRPAHAPDRIRAPGGRGATPGVRAASRRARGTAR